MGQILLVKEKFRIIGHVHSPFIRKLPIQMQHIFGCTVQIKKKCAGIPNEKVWLHVWNTSFKKILMILRGPFVEGVTNQSQSSDE